MLKPDVFHEPRLLGFPPAVGAFLVCFNRFHNYAATQLALVNEGGRFTKPTVLPQNHSEEEQEQYDRGLEKYDEELFQTARL